MSKKACHVEQNLVDQFTLSDVQRYFSNHTWGPARGWGGPMSPVWILKRLVSVFINACRLLSALPSLSQFGRGRLSLVAISFYALSLLIGPCRLSEFTLAGPRIFLMIKTPLLLHIKQSQTNTESILIVSSFHYPLKKERRKEKQVLESYITVSIKENFNLNYEKFL